MVKKNNLVSVNLPSSLKNTTLNDLIHSDDVDLHKTKGKLAIRKSTSEGTLTIQYEEYGDGYQKCIQTAVPKKNKKKDYTNEIKQLKKAGMKQKDIAFELGMSEAYVSKLSKKQ